MPDRLIARQERWLLAWPAWALVLALAWRVLAGALLWRGPGALTHGLGLIDSQLIAAAALLALLALARLFIPRDYAAAAGLLLGGAAYWCGLELLPRHGLLLHWPLGRLALGWYIAAGLLVLAAVFAQGYCGLRWRHALRGHGVTW